MATYWVKSGTGGTDAGTSWSNAAESIAGLMTAQAIVGGDIIYVHNTHNHNAGAAITWTLPESGTGLVQVLCVDGGDATGASLVDGTVGNLTTGATETTGGNFGFTINTNSSANAALYVHGMNLTMGAGGNFSTNFIISGQQGKIQFNACNIWVNSVGAASGISIGTTNSTIHTAFTKCVFRFANSGHDIAVATPVVFEGCSINSSGASPTTLFTAFQATRPAHVLCHGCDWSLATNVVSVSNSWTSATWKFSNCVIATPTTGSFGGHAAGGIEFQACAAADGANGADILSYYYADPFGTVQDNQSVYKSTGGAQGEQDDGTDTSYSLQMDPSASASPAFPLYTPWIYALVGSTGAKTVAMVVAHTEAAVLTDLDVFMEVEYMGEPGATGTQRVANSPMSVTEVDDDAPIVSSTIYRDVLYAAAANRTDDGLDDWTGLTSEKEHTLTATVTCDEVGYIRCRVGLTKDTTNPVYVDPKISVT